MFHAPFSMINHISCDLFENQRFFRFLFQVIRIHVEVMVYMYSSLLSKLKVNQAQNEGKNTETQKHENCFLMLI